jgi:hypothetical protein
VKETASTVAKIASSRFANEKLTAHPLPFQENTCNHGIRTFLKSIHACFAVKEELKKGICPNWTTK